MDVEAQLGDARDAKLQHHRNAENLNWGCNLCSMLCALTACL